MIKHEARASTAVSGARNVLTMPEGDGEDGNGKCVKNCSRKNIVNVLTGKCGL